MTGLGFIADATLSVIVIGLVVFIYWRVWPIWMKYGEKSLQQLFDQSVTQYQLRALNEQQIAALHLDLYLQPPPSSAQATYTSKTQIAEKEDGGNTFWLIYNQHFFQEKIDNMPYEERTWSFSVLIKFSRSLPGHVKIGPESGLNARFRHDLELESAEFNRHVFVASQPPKLRYAILPPDFMDWYMGLPQKPWVTVEGQICHILMSGRVDQTILDQFISRAQSIAQYIEKSGALELSMTSQ